MKEEELHIGIDPVVNPVPPVDAPICTQYPTLGHKSLLFCEGIKIVFSAKPINYNYLCSAI